MRKVRIITYNWLRNRAASYDDYYATRRVQAQSKYLAEIAEIAQFHKEASKSPSEIEKVEMSVLRDGWMKRELK